ncbi:pyridoxal phosphate-dependent transferase [Trichophaea hybrida]|nr:pyridoxal phosphate-dependent transferase [Trichophaea hybrida]
MQQSPEIINANGGNGIYEAGNATNSVEKTSAWLQPGPAAFDFRSDITTTSTPAMLCAITHAGVNDGWSGNGAASFEAHVAQLASREAALFMISSTMGNQIAIRTHLGRPPNGVICDARSHMIHQEAGGVASMSGALPQILLPSNGLYLTVEDIERKIVLSDGKDACTCPTRLIHLENPLGGIIMPLAELRRIKRFATDHGLKVHMDGARLWEAVVAGAGSLPEFCAEVDSVNLCLTKGLGAPVGSILLGDGEFVRHARWIRKSIGGAMRQPGVVVAAAWAAMDEAFGRDPCGRESILGRSHELAKRMADYWSRLGGKLSVPQETNMVWLDLEAAGIDEEAWEKQGEIYGLLLHCSRLVTHYQISDEAVERLEAFMKLAMMEPERKGPICNIIPRNEAVARLAASMKEAMTLSALQKAQ